MMSPGSTKPQTFSQTNRNTIFRAIAKNEVDILYLTPEMLCSDALANEIPQLHINYEEDDDDVWTSIALLAIDEVHCISEWGHDFRPAYYSGLRTILNNSPWAMDTVKLGASAAVPKRVQNDLQKVIGKWEVVRGKLFRSNLAIRVIPALNSTSDKLRWLEKWFTNSV